MNPDSYSPLYLTYRMAKTPPRLLSSGSAPSEQPFREHGEASMAKPEFRLQRLTEVYGATDWYSFHSRIWQ